MSSIPQLTKGVVMLLHNGSVDSAKGGLVQVIHVQTIQPQQGPTPPASAAAKKENRIKVTLSDGQHSIPAILSNNAANLIQNNNLQVYNIVRLNDCIINAIGGKKVAILYSCDVVAKPTALIGNPQDIERVGSQTVAGAAGAPPMPQQRTSPAMPQQPPMPPQQQRFQQPQQQFQQQQQQRPPAPQASPAPQRFGNAMPQQPQQTFGQQQQQQQQQAGRFGQPAQPQQQQQFAARPAPGQPPAPAQQRFTGHQQQPQFQQQRQSQPIQRLQGSGAISSAAVDINLDDSNFVPIRSLNPYMNSWQIKARITSKSDIKTWDKQGKAGKLFSVDLIDKDGSEIRATFFNELVDRHYSSLEPNQVYVISKGRLKYANRKFSTLPSEYEITIDDSTIIQHVTEDTTISAGNFNFVDLDQITSLEDNSTLDIIGIVSNPGEQANIQTKAGETRAKRTITLVSCSLNPQAANPGAAYSIDLTVWGEKSSLNNLALGDVLLCKSVKKSSFGGASVNSGPGTTFQINPTIPQTAQLLDWYGGGANVSEVSAMTTKGGGRGGDGVVREAKQRKTLLDLDGMGESEKGDYAIVKAYIASVKRNEVTYPSCPVSDCKGKKMKIQPGGSELSCPNCGAFGPVHRYMLSVQIMDSFSGKWVTAFGEEAAKLLCMDADYFQEHTEAADAAVERLRWKEFVFKLRVKDDTFQGQQGTATRKKVSIFTVYPCYATSEAKKLMGLVSQYEKLRASQGQHAGGAAASAAAANGAEALSFADPQYGGY